MFLFLMIRYWFLMGGCFGGVFILFCLFGINFVFIGGLLEGVGFGWERFFRKIGILFLLLRCIFVMFFLWRSFVIILFLCKWIRWICVLIDISMVFLIFIIFECI